MVHDVAVLLSRLMTRQSKIAVSNTLEASEMADILANATQSGAASAVAHRAVLSRAWVRLDRIRVLGNRMGVPGMAAMALVGEQARDPFVRPSTTKCNATRYNPGCRWTRQPAVCILCWRKGVEVA
jgi:hypothetical protein